MKKRIMDSLLQTALRHKWLKAPCFIVLTVYLFFYHLCVCIRHNCKKLVCTVILLCFLTAGSSFAFEEADVVYSDNSDKHEGKEQCIQQVNLEAESQDESLAATTVEDTELLEDKDVTEGYENSEFEYVTANERFDASDILDANDDYYSGNGQTVSEQVSVSKDDWSLVLINKQHSVPDDYEFTLGTITGGMKCDERIIPYLLDMLQAAKNEGINLVICSPYRDINRQKVLFNRKITAYMKKGMSYMEAYRITAQAVTVPGASEHQIGLALDIICDSYSSLNEGFGDTDAGRWLAAHSCEYGFVLRYPKGKEYITGIEFEPWHFRYVGKEAAEIITEKGITLEEFIDMLPD